MQVTPFYGVQGSAPENFGFGPYVRLGGPTYGFVHDFRTCFFGRNGFWSMVLNASACINMYCNTERNIMKNQAGSPGFGIQGKISVCVFYVLCSRIVYFLCFRIRMQVIYVRG